VNELKLKVVELEQHSLGHSVEIKGILKKYNENYFIVQTIPNTIVVTVLHTYNMEYFCSAAHIL
jgi:hypothetical protein